MGKIKIFNFHTKEYEIEKTFGENFLNFVYLTKTGKLLRPIFNSKLFSKIYSLKKKSKNSYTDIENFISLYNINDGLFKPYKDSYKSFNDYFIRVFKDGVRKFDEDPLAFSAFCEARYMIIDLKSSNLFNVKNKKINLNDLVQNQALADKFQDAFLVVARLAPVDYHHYHYPVNGSLMSSYKVGGKLDSVTPIATKFKGEVFLNNERVINVLNANEFGEIVYIEVGALAVGKIMNINEKKHFFKGEAKGYFEFGGSTVLCLIKREEVLFSQEILDQSSLGIETYIHLGETIGYRRKV